jgi:hypothetical protein
MRRDSKGFIDMKGIAKFGVEYCVVPILVNQAEVAKVVKFFQKKSDQEIIDFEAFVLALFCIAHIG